MPDNASTSDRKSDTSGLIKELWQSGVWKLFPLLLLYITGQRLAIALLLIYITQNIPESPSFSPAQHYEVCFVGAGYGVIVPVTPTLMTDFFASRHSDVYIHCEDYTSQKAPLPCRDAHSDAVNWSSASSFVSNSILSFALVGLHCPILATSSCTCVCHHIIVLPLAICSS